MAARPPAPELGADRAHPQPCTSRPDDRRYWPGHAAAPAPPAFSLAAPAEPAPGSGPPADDNNTTADVLVVNAHGAAAYQFDTSLGGPAAGDCFGD